MKDVGAPDWLGNPNIAVFAGGQYASVPFSWRSRSSRLSSCRRCSRATPHNVTSRRRSFRGPRLAASLRILSVEHTQKAVELQSLSQPFFSLDIARQIAHLATRLAIRNFLSLSDRRGDPHMCRAASVPLRFKPMRSLRQHRTQVGFVERRYQRRDLAVGGPTNLLIICRLS